jgi:GxxExxY protein
MDKLKFSAEGAENAEERRGRIKMPENQITQQIIGAAIEVHKELGAGIIEKAYEESLCHEMHLRGLKFRRQQAVPISYKGVKLSADLWLDLLVEDKVIVDLKAKVEVTALDQTKLLTYLRLSNLRVGLIINFHVERLVDGVSRVVNQLVEPGDSEELPDLRL